MDPMINDSESRAVVKQKMENDHQSSISSSGDNADVDIHEKLVEHGGATVIEHNQEEGTEASCDAQGEEKTEMMEVPINIMEMFSDPTDSSSESAENDKMFTLFPKIPIEIRLKIWKDALPGPRIIEFHYELLEADNETSITDDDGATVSEDREAEPSSEQDISTIKTKLPPPILLNVCRESREVSLKKYCLPLNTTDELSFRIDPVEDILFIPYFHDRYTRENKCRYSNVLSTKVKEKIQNLAIDVDMLKRNFFQNLTSLTSLKELTLVFHDDECMDGWQCKSGVITFFEPTTNIKTHVSNRTRWLRYIEGLTKKLEPRQPPHVEVKCMTRGGIACDCYERYEDYDSSSDDGGPSSSPEA